MGDQVRQKKALWAVAEVMKKAVPGFYGRVEVYYENGNVTHYEATERHKAPVDTGKPEM